MKKTRGILNKLTPDNFDKLVQKFMELKLEDRDERISKVIKVVFEKAVDEPSFSKEYAKMVSIIPFKINYNRGSALLLDSILLKFLVGYVGSTGVRNVCGNLQEV